MTFRTRFAPSPTGRLHLGHAYSAILAHEMATKANGEFLLRIEDIDQSRARAEWEELIYKDLRWLGLSWPTPVMRQSERLEAYSESLHALHNQGLLYPCRCSRADIKAALNAPQEGAMPVGPDGLIYPGTCRPKNAPTQPFAPGDTLRLNLNEIAKRHGAELELSFLETGPQNGRIKFTLQEMIDTVGDVVLARAGMGTSYHLAVVLDDAAQEVTHVVRGMDLFDATKIHVLLQHIMGISSPIYHHHDLIRDDNGRRLAKRDDARAIRTYRQDGHTPDSIRQMVGLTSSGT